MKNSIIQTPIRFALSLGLLAWSTAACAPQRSADKMAPPIEYKTDRLSSDGLEYEFNPKVDILFVIDHSDSMLEEQTKLKEAADRFVESFGENSLIDYRVGIVSVHDSRRCGTVDPKTQLPIECYPEGRLRPLKGAPSTASPFVVRNEGAQKILKESLAFGTQSLKDGGPRFEELFSPILIATSPEGNQANGGFLRPDSRLVIVMVTDEDDSSASISVEDFLFQLQSNVGLSRVELNAVVATEGCARNNYADAPDKILRAVKMMKGRVFPICNASFG